MELGRFSPFEFAETESAEESIIIDKIVSNVLLALLASDFAKLFFD